MLGPAKSMRKNHPISHRVRSKRKGEAGTIIPRLAAVGTTSALGVKSIKTVLCLAATYALRSRA
jgi:hypothetical protein